MRKLLFDFFPIIAFFVVFKQYEDPQEGVLAATAAIMVATAAQMGWTWFKFRRIERMHLWTLLIVMFFGGLTLWFKDEMFIKWKPTIVNWLFAAAFAGSQLFMEKPLVQRMLGSSISLPQPAWNRLNIAWVAFFIVCGVANLYVVYTFDTDTWVNFKLFGMLGLTVLFMAGQVWYLMRHMEPEPEPGSEAVALQGDAAESEASTRKPPGPDA